MKSSSSFSVRPSAALAIALLVPVLGVDAIHAQVVPGAGGPVIGQTPGQAPSSIIGQPVPGGGQPAPGQPGSALNQPVPGGGQPAPGQPGSALSQPVPGQGGAATTRPYPGTGSAGGRDVTRDALDRANRDAASINLDGRIDPGEAARMPGITPPGRTPLPRY
jgi:hypothetical protein